jgi:hypothetical protein
LRHEGLVLSVRLSSRQSLVEGSKVEGPALSLSKEAKPKDKSSPLKIRGGRPARLPSLTCPPHSYGRRGSFSASRPEHLPARAWQAGEL